MAAHPPGWLVRTDRPLPHWRATSTRSLVVVGDSIANQFTEDLRAHLRAALPGGTSFGYAGLAGVAFGRWTATGTWEAVGTGPANLGLPGTRPAARRSTGGAEDRLAWKLPRSWVADRAELHWVDDHASGRGFSYRVDGGPWADVPCDAPAAPTFRTTPLGPVRVGFEVRAATADGAPTPSPVFLGVDVRENEAATVVHSLTFPGGRIAGRSGDDADACLRPDRLDVALAHLARLEPTLVVWQGVNDAVALDADRLRAALAAAVERIPDADHVGVGVHEVDGGLRHAAGQDELRAVFTGPTFPVALDLAPRWGPPDAARAAGLLRPDGIHPTRAGGADLGRAVAELLLALGA